MKNIILIAASAVLSVVFLILFFAARTKARENPENKACRRRKTLFFVLLLLSAWFTLGTVCNILLGGSKGIQINFEMFAPRMELFGISIAETTVIMWAIMAVILVLALLFRFVCVPKFSLDKPTKIQNVMESLVELIDNYTNSNVHGDTGCLSSYLMAVCVFMLGCAMVELVDLRAPTSDIMVTFSFGLVTFFLINFYGIRRKKLSGRLKSLASPTPVVFPFRIISDIAVPVSLACRLFGNMLGGMIVMELLKGAAGGYMLGVAPVAGLYFNVFHPLIQIYIFITLSLTFINEAVE